MWSSPSLARGAIVGAALGVAISLALLVIGSRGGEKTELAAFLAAALGTPVSIPFAMGAWFTDLSNWVLFVLLVVPLNGALVGAAAGRGASAIRWQNPWWLVAIPVIWFLVLSVTAWWARTH